MAEYIERERLTMGVLGLTIVDPMVAQYADAVLLQIQQTPAADVAPVVHGRWELHGNDDDCGCSYFCSNCGASYDEDWFYNRGQFSPFRGCPNCLARMDGEG